MMSNSLNENYLFVGPHLTINDVYHYWNFDMKSDQSLKYVKKQKELNDLKEQVSNRIRFS